MDIRHLSHKCLLVGEHRLAYLDADSVAARTFGSASMSVEPRWSSLPSFQGARRLHRKRGDGAIGRWYGFLPDVVQRIIGRQPIPSCNGPGVTPMLQSRVLEMRRRGASPMESALEPVLEVALSQ